MLVFRRGLVVAVLVVVLLTAGIAVASSSATHQQWVANANAACTWGGTQRKKLGPNNGTVAQWLIVLPKLRNIQVEVVRRIRLVTPPPSDQMLVHDLIFTYWLKDIAEERHAYLLLKAKDVEGFKKSLARIFWYERNEDVLLRALGTKCRQV